MRYGEFRKSTKAFEPPPEEVQRDPRFGVTFVSAVEMDGRRIPVQIFDLSERGIGGRSSNPLPIGAKAVIALPGLGPVAIQIRWALGARFGARFLNRIDLDPDRTGDQQD